MGAPDRLEEDGGGAPEHGVLRVAVVNLCRHFCRHPLAYTHQSVLLGLQLRKRYPEIPMLALAIQGGLFQEEIGMLSSIYLKAIF